MGSCVACKKRPTTLQQCDTISISASQFIQETKGNFYSSYRMGKMLGKGGFGTVYLCAHRDTNELRAVKVIDKRTFDSQTLEAYLNEVKVLKTLDHPNIVRLFEVFEDSKRCYLITE